MNLTNNKIMDWNPLKFVVTLTFVTAIVIVDVNASKCVINTSCSCHLADGSFYDLSKVSAESMLNGTKDNFTFSFHPCKDVKMTLGYISKNVTSCNNITGVSLCARIKDDIPFSLGDTSETQWSVPDNGIPELILIHGSNTTRITLSYCPTCKSSNIILDSAPDASGPAGQYHFVLSSPHVSKTEGPPEGISTGSVLVILLFVFSGLYLLTGALALRFFRGAIGWELIPNYDFWSDLPALVRDGVAFTFSGCSVDSYDRI